MPKLTAISVEKWKPDPAKRQEIPDSRMPGLYLIVQPSGVKSWAVRYRHRGRSKKLTLGPLAQLDLGKARDEARDALQGVEKGKDPASEKRHAKQAPADGKVETFEQAAREFIERYARPYNRSWLESARLLGMRPAGEDFVVIPGSAAALWGERRISEVTKSDVLGLLDGMVDRDCGIAANRTLAVIRRVYNRLIERDLIGASPCAGLKPPAPETSRDRVLDDGELRLVWKATEAVGFPFGPFTRLLILTGQRRREVAAMERSEIRDRLWTVPKERAKNDVAHEVPLSAAAMTLLDGLPHFVGTYVFTTTGAAPISGFSRAKQLLDAAVRELTGKDAEIPPWTFHDLRRSVASGLAKLKVSPHVIEAVLNHRSGTVSGIAAIYNRHGYALEKREALELWAQHLEHLVAK